MKTTIKYHVLKNSGKKSSIKVTYDNCPDFIDTETIGYFSKHPTKDGFVQIRFNKDESMILDGNMAEFKFSKSIEDQIDQWIESFDKSNWMHDNDVSIIFNWTVISYEGMINGQSTDLIVTQIKHSKPESAIDQMKLFLSSNNDVITQDFVDNYIVVYASLEENIRKLSWAKQMEITLKAMEISTKAASVAYDNIMGYSKALEKVDWNKYRYTQAQDINKYGNWDMDAIHREAKMIQNGHQTNNNLIIDKL